MILLFLSFMYFRFLWWSCSLWALIVFAFYDDLDLSKLYAFLLSTMILLLLSFIDFSISAMILLILNFMCFSLSTMILLFPRFMHFIFFRWSCSFWASHVFRFLRLFCFFLRFFFDFCVDLTPSELCESFLILPWNLLFHARHGALRFSCTCLFLDFFWCTVHNTTRSRSQIFYALDSLVMHVASNSWIYSHVIFLWLVSMITNSLSRFIGSNNISVLMTPFNSRPISCFLSCKVIKNRS